MKKKNKWRDYLKKQGGIKLVKQYIYSGCFFTALNQFLVLGKSRTALEILRLSASLKVKNKLKKKYKRKLLELNNSYQENTINYEKKIWVCWLQGIENAPEIVKVCYNSLCKNITDRSIVLITEKNYKDFIKFPDFIQKKIDNQIIKGAHMTDLLRLELLEKYGGTWIDATVFCSNSRIPKYMLNSELFLFQSLKPGKDGHATVVSNWFITAKPHHKYIYILKNLMYEYWKKNNKLVDYFIFHDFFQIIIDNYSDEWKNVIPFSNSTPHILLLRLFEKYDEEIWNAIKEQTPFHKLTYKFDEKQIIEECYYSKIIKSNKI